MDGGLDAGADARGSAMDAPIGARASAKGAGALSAVRGRIAQVKLRITAVSSGLIAAAMCGLPARAQEMRTTAQEVIAAVQEHVGVPWKAQTGDTFKAGNPETRVTGIAVTMMGTPDGILAGIVKSLGWEKYQSAANPHLFTVPEITLEKLAADVAKQLNTPVLRVVGNPAMKVTKLALSPGSAGFERETHALEMENVEVLLVGETREWETVEYAADAVTEGKRKALIVIGHVPSEQAGMDEAARWLKTFVKSVPVEFLPTKQPFWTPEQRNIRR